MAEPSDNDYELALGTIIQGSTNTYRLDSLLGKGIFGIAYSAAIIKDGSEQQDQEPVAVKVLRGLGHNQKLYDLEVSNLEKASRLSAAARITRLVEAFVEGAYGCFIVTTTPVCREGSVMDLLKGQGATSYSLMTAMRWAYSVTQTLHALHTTDGVRLYHGDLHPRNVLLRAESSSGLLEAYVADLGIALHNHPYGMNDDQRGVSKYSASVAPEMLEGTRSFDDGADVWSWGVFLYALLDRSMQRLEYGSNEDGVVQRAFFRSLPCRSDLMAYFNACWSSGEEVPPQLLDLLLGSVRDPPARLSMRAILIGLKALLPTKGKHMNSTAG